MRAEKKACNLSRKVEDYLESILNVTIQKGYARTKDIAEEMSLSPSSVVEMFKKLDKLGLVEYRRYEGVVLKEKGREIAEVIKYRHETLKKFLMLIKVPEKTANEDACFMEHELHPETVRQIRTLIEILENNRTISEDIKRMIDSGKY
jgi:DtxR family Mn-dependent transcriptional regulator